MSEKRTDTVCRRGGTTGRTWLTSPCAVSSVAAGSGVPPLRPAPAATGLLCFRGARRPHGSASAPPNSPGFSSWQITCGAPPPTSARFSAWPSANTIHRLSERPERTRVGEVRDPFDTPKRHTIDPSRPERLPAIRLRCRHGHVLPVGRHAGYSPGEPGHLRRRREDEPRRPARRCHRRSHEPRGRTDRREYHGEDRERPKATLALHRARCDRCRDPRAAFSNPRELDQQIVRRGPPVVGVLREAAPDDMIERWWNGGDEPRGWRGLVAEDGAREARHGGRREGARAREHLVQHRAEREYVGARVGFASFDLLRRHVRHRANHQPLRGQWRVQARRIPLLRRAQWAWPGRSRAGGRHSS